MQGIAARNTKMVCPGRAGVPRADGRLEAGENFGGQKELLQAVHAQHAGAGNGRFMHGIGAGQRAGVRGGGLLSRRAAPGLEHDDRLVARRRARGRHELARVLDRFDAQQDGARVRVAGQVVQHVGSVHVGVLAQCDKVRKTDAARLRPVQHGGDQRVGLRDQGQLARLGRGGRDAGVQVRVRRQQAHAVGPQDAQQPGARGVQHGLLLLGREAGADDHGGLGAGLGQLPDQIVHRGGRGADHGQLRHAGQIAHAGIAALAGQLLVFGVERPERALEAAGVHVAPQRGAGRKRPLGGADDRHRLRMEQRVEVADAHGVDEGPMVIRLRP